MIEELTLALFSYYLHFWFMVYFDCRFWAVHLKSSQRLSRYLTDGDSYSSILIIVLIIEQMPMSITAVVELPDLSEFHSEIGSARCS